MDALNEQAKALGIWLAPRIQTEEWRGMEDDLWATLRDRISKIPWLPVGWLASVERLRTPEVRIMPIPGRIPAGRNPNLPSWIDTPEKVAAWDEMSKRLNGIVTVFSAGMLEKGREEMAAAYADAAFWDGIYGAVKAIADAPAKIVGAAGEFATGLVGSFLKAWWPVIIFAGVAFIVYANRDKLAGAAGNKLAKAMG